MTNVIAQVPKDHLATEMGSPNVQTVDYSNEILLPVSGPLAIAVIIRDFSRSIVDCARFLAFSKSASDYIKKIGAMDVTFAPSKLVDDPYYTLTSKFDTDFLDPIRTNWHNYLAKSLKDKVSDPEAVLYHSGVRRVSTFPIEVKTSDVTTLARLSLSRGIPRSVPMTPDRPTLQQPKVYKQSKLLEVLSNPNQVFRDAFEANILRSNNTLLRTDFLEVNTTEKLRLLLEALTKLFQDQAISSVPTGLLAATREAIKRSERLIPTPVRDVFVNLSEDLKRLLAIWLAIQLKRSRQAISGLLGKDLKGIFGFVPLLVYREWAFRREEKLELQFGKPDLRGPFLAEPVTPQGTLSREEYFATQNELTLLTAEQRQEIQTATQSIGASSLQRSLNTIYYAGQGSLNDLTSDAISDSILSEERRNVVDSILQQISKTRESTYLRRSAETSSTTLAKKSIGVDNKQSTTLHHFRVVVPVHATIYLENVGLTWCPRLSNPFMELRAVIRDEYNRASNEYKTQHYVTVPVRPAIDWEAYSASTQVDISIEGDTTRKGFKIFVHVDLNSEGVDIRYTKADLSRATVTYESEGSWWENDPDSWCIYLVDIQASEPLHTITGTIVFETSDRHWYTNEAEGVATVTVPILRYSEATINAFAQYEAQLEDYERKVQAIEARAHQYARIRQKELITRHERLDDLLKIVFNTLMRRVCSPLYLTQVSYYQEIIRRCIDWNQAKIEFELQRMNNLIYPDYPPGHFMNSPGIRLFLPVIRSAEDVFLDTMQECGTVFFRNSVNSARTKIDDFRQRLRNRTDKKIDEFDTEMVIGDHVEAVLSNYDFGT